MKRPFLAARARAALGWIVLAFFAAQLCFTVVVDCCFPLFYDPETTERLGELRRCLAREPERPLMLLLGSSRTAMSFRPETVGPLRPETGPQPLVYNYSHLGAPPAFHVLQLDRLLRWGIRPSWLVVELMPPLLSNDVSGILSHGAVTPELPLALRYTPTGKFLSRFLMHRIIPWHRNRTLLLTKLAPAWLDPETLHDQEKAPLGLLGWDHRFWAGDLNAQELQRRTSIAHGDYGPVLQTFQIKARLTRPIEDLLDRCSRENIPVVLVLTPESRGFRSWYRPGSEAQIQDFCAKLSHKYGVPIVDGRTWLPDEDFMDGHHVLPQGADDFTHRLEREVLQPLVTQGRTGPRGMPLRFVSR